MLEIKDYTTAEIITELDVSPTNEISLKPATAINNKTTPHDRS